MNKSVVQPPSCNPPSSPAPAASSLGMTFVACKGSSGAGEVSPARAGAPAGRRNCADSAAADEACGPINQNVKNPAPSHALFSTYSPPPAGLTVGRARRPTPPRRECNRTRAAGARSGNSTGRLTKMLAYTNLMRAGTNRGTIHDRHDRSTGSMNSSGASLGGGEAPGIGARAPQTARGAARTPG